MRGRRQLHELGLRRESLVGGAGGRLSWSKSYLWRTFVKDGANEVMSADSVLLASVPQPDLISRIAGSPDAEQGRELTPQYGNLQHLGDRRHSGHGGPRTEPAAYLQQRGPSASASSARDGRPGTT